MLSDFFNLVWLFLSRATVSAKNLSYSSNTLNNTKNVKLQRALREMECMKDYARRNNNNHIQSEETSQTVVIAGSYTHSKQDEGTSTESSENFKSEAHVTYIQNQSQDPPKSIQEPTCIIHEKSSPTIKRVTRSMKTMNETSHASSNVIKRVTRSMCAKDESTIKTTSRLTRSKAKK